MELEKIFALFSGEPQEAIPVLQAVQEELGYLPKEALEHAARFLGIAPGELLGIVTFFAQFRLKPIGKNIITVCKGTACHVRGSAGILREFEKILSINEGETDANREFTLQTIACFGACARAPVTVVEKLGVPGRKVYGGMTTRRAGKLVEDIRGKMAEKSA